MKFNFRFNGLVFILFLLFSCRENGEIKSGETKEKSVHQSIKYAKYFDIKPYPGYQILFVFGKNGNADTTARFVVYDSIQPQINLGEKVHFIHAPCRSVVALSSIYSAMLKEVGALNCLTGIDNVDYIIDTTIVRQWERGQLMELSKGQDPDVEKLIQLHPDVVLMYGMGKPEEEINQKLKKSKLPFALIVDHLEETPLARAEWIKFISAFVGKQKMADSLFNLTEQRYLSLRDSVSKLQNRPSVFAELKYGETWFVPGGKSFVATFINDASADYCWKEDESSGSLALSFEQVYRKAHQSDVWINLSMVQSKKDILAQDSRYKNFAAFQKGELYNNNKKVNAKGYSEYWETAMFHPERVLMDLILIFHGTEYQQKDLYYYRKIN